jgi:AhpC/TSA family
MLQERLDEIRAKSATRLPPEAQAIMRKSIQDLQASGIMDRIVQVGTPAPDFVLPDAAGVPVRLAHLLAQGPVVLSFYRGRW